MKKVLCIEVGSLVDIDKSKAAVVPFYLVLRHEFGSSLLKFFRSFLLKNEFLGLKMEKRAHKSTILASKASECIKYVFNKPYEQK